MYIILMIIVCSVVTDFQQIFLFAEFFLFMFYKFPKNFTLRNKINYYIE